MNSKVFFLLDFDSNIGFGHLSRCSNLAIFLREKGINTILITSMKSSICKPNNFTKRLLLKFQQIIQYKNSHENSNSNHIPSIEIQNLTKNHTVIIDHYHLDKDIILMFKEAKKIIQFKDDINDLDYLNVSNPNHKIIYFLPTEILPKQQILSQNIYSGIDLIPLFKPSIELSRPEKYSQEYRNIFIAPGSSNISFVKSIINFIQIEIGNKTNKIFMPKPFRDYDIKYVDGTNGLESYLYYSDLVISAGGNTMLESLYLGKETIAFCTNKNQLSLIYYLEKEGMLTYIEPSNSWKDKIRLKLSLDFQAKELADPEKIYFKSDNLIKLIN
tara:strand:- start:7504 stop:8490 length:987 start_codon:yes stop_codon:yes gene_type:complete